MGAIGLKDMIMTASQSVSVESPRFRRPPASHSAHQILAAVEVGTAVAAMLSERQEATLLCHAVLRGAPVEERALLVDVREDTTRLVLAVGDAPIAIWNIGVGPSRSARTFIEALRCARIGVLRRSISRAIAISRPGVTAGERAFVVGAIARALDIAQVSLAPRGISAGPEPGAHVCAT